MFLICLLLFYFKYFTLISFCNDLSSVTSFENDATTINDVFNRMQTINKTVDKLNNYFISINCSNLKMAHFNLNDLDINSILDNIKLLEYTFEYEID